MYILSLEEDNLEDHSRNEATSGAFSCSYYELEVSDSKRKTDRATKKLIYIV